MINCAVILARRGEFVGEKVNQTEVIYMHRSSSSCDFIWLHAVFFICRSSVSFLSLRKQCHLEVYYENY